jgi:hypothetical protein
MLKQVVHGVTGVNNSNNNNNNTNNNNNNIIIINKHKFVANVT